MRKTSSILFDTAYDVISIAMCLAAALLKYYNI